MSIFESSWNKIEIKKIPGSLGTPDVPSGSRRPRKLIPAVFDPKSADADSDGWRQEGTTARWYGLIPSNPIYKTVLRNLERIKDPEGTTDWLPVGMTNLDEWLGTIDEIENHRLRAPKVELSTREADLSFIAGQVDLRARQAQASGREAPNIASETRRAAAWVKGREIQRRRFGKADEFFSDADQSITVKADQLIEDLKKQRIERDARIKQIVELDPEVAKLAREFDPTKYVESRMELWEWSDLNEEEYPRPVRGEFETERDYLDAVTQWNAESNDRWIDYENGGGAPGDGLDDAVGSIFDFSFTSTDGDNYYVQVDYIDDASQEGMKLNFSIRTEGEDSSHGYPDGTQVGNLERSLNFYDGTVYHDIFMLDENVRGGQISGIINARNEQIYELMGIKQISVSATSSQSMNGATHWPKVGFDWGDSMERDSYIKVIEKALDAFASDIEDNPDELPWVILARNANDIKVPIFASREEAEVVRALIERAKTEQFDDPNRLTAGDLVNWAGAEAWFKQSRVTGHLVKAVGSSAATRTTKWLIIEPEYKAVVKPNKPNLPNTPKKPSISGGGPSKPRALKPAVFDPKSVDVDNDGWHQEGTTAAWFGAGLNNPVVKELQDALGKLTDDDRESSYAAMVATHDYGIFEGAPRPEASTAEADLSWLGGKIIINKQQEESWSGGGPPPRFGGVDRSLEAQWLQGREEARRRGGVREQVIPTPEIEKLDDETVFQAIDKAITIRQERRAILDGKTRVKADDALTDDIKEKAESFNVADYPADEQYEVLNYEDWRDAEYDPRPERMEYPMGGTPEQMAEYDANMAESMRWSADSWDAWMQYKSDQEALANAELRGAVAEIYEFEFLGNNGKKYSTRVDSVVQGVVELESGGEGTVFTMKGVFLNEEGEPVGIFERSFYPDLGMITHDHLKINESERGSQVSGIFNSRNEITYQKMGYHTIGVGAMSGKDYNGATHWPKVGFDWMDDDERENYLLVVEDALTEFALAIKDDPDALPMLTKLIDDPDHEDQTSIFANPTEVKIPIFASREEAESVALLIAVARDQDFDDADRLTVGDFVNWPGAELFFQQKGHQTQLTRSIGGQKESADIQDVTPDADVAVGGMSSEEIQEKNKKILNELEATGSSFGRIDEDYKRAQEQAVAEGRVNSLHIPKTREEAIEIRRETTSATITAVRAYLETGELTPWNGRVGISESDAEALDNMPQALRELILTSSDEELNEMILSQATRMQEEVKAGRIRVNVTDARLGAVVEDGEYKTVFSGAQTENARVAGREQIDARILGISSDVAPELHPASGYAITREQGQAVSKDGNAEDTELASKLTGIGETYGDVVFELKPEVADRTSWSLGDSMNAKGPGVVRMDEDDPEYIAAVMINGSDTKKPQNVVLNMLESERNETTLTASVSRLGGIPAAESLDAVSGAGHDYIETNIAGSFDLDEVDSIRVPSIETLKKSALPVASDADDLIEGRFMDREKLKAAGLTEGQISYLLELKESDPSAYREYFQNQRLQSVLYAEEVDRFGKSLFEKHGVRLLIGDEGRSPEQEVEKRLQEAESFYKTLARDVDRAIASGNEDARRVAEGLPTLAQERQAAREAEEARIAAGGGLDAGGIG